MDFLHQLALLFPPLKQSFLLFRGSVALLLQFFQIFLLGGQSQLYVPAYGGDLYVQILNEALGIVQLGWFCGLFHPHARGGSIHQVYRLVWQLPTGDVACGKFDRGGDSLIGDLDAVMSLENAFCGTKHETGIVFRWLIHLNRLESSRQSRVFFDIPLILREGGGPNSPQFAASQFRL